MTPTKMKITKSIRERDKLNAPAEKAVPTTFMSQVFARMALGTCSPDHGVMEALTHGKTMYVVSYMGILLYVHNCMNSMSLENDNMW